MQDAVISYHRQSPELCEQFSPDPPGGRGDPTIARNEQRVEKRRLNGVQNLRAYCTQNVTNKLVQKRSDFVRQSNYVVEIGFAIEWPNLCSTIANNRWNDLRQRFSSFGVDYDFCCTNGRLYVCSKEDSHSVEKLS